MIKIAISIDEFKNAFRQVVSFEFSHIPVDEDKIEFTFSKRFHNKMNKVINLQKKVYWNIINTCAKRVVLVCVSFIVIFTTLFSVKAIREPIFNFIEEVYETFVRYCFRGNDVDEITYEYKVGELPKGFVEKETVKNSISIIKIYENVEGESIEFYQNLSYNTGHTVDLEKGNVYKISVSDMEISIYDSIELKEAIWIKDIYVLRLVCYGDFSIDNIKNIIENIE